MAVVGLARLPVIQTADFPANACRTTAATVLTPIVAVALFVAYFAPIVWKLKDGALIAVIVIGLVLMNRDLWDSLKDEDN